MDMHKSPFPGFSSPAEDSSRSESVKEEHPASSAVPDLLSRMKVDAEIHAASRDTGKDITALFSSAGQNISLNGPLSLDMTLSGTPVSPRARLNISCPALNMGKEQLSNLHFRPVWTVWKIPRRSFTFQAILMRAFS